MKENTFLYYLKYTALAALLIFLIILYVLELPYFNNTFQIGNLIVGALFFGSFIGAIIGYTYKNHAKDVVERFQIYALFIAFSIIFMPLLASLSNRLFAFQTLQQEQVEVFKVEPFLSDRFGILKGEVIQADGYYVFFIRNGELERLKINTAIFANKKKGDWIQLPIQKGFWGSEFVSEAVLAQKK